LPRVSFLKKIYIQKSRVKDGSNAIPTEKRYKHITHIAELHFL